MLFSIVLSFIIGLAAILVAARIFLILAQELAARWGVSPLFVSLVLLAIGTNLPEISVTFSAISQQDPGLALGNLVGSSVANITLILGATAAFHAVKIGTRKTQITARILVVVTLFFISLQLSSLSPLIQAIGLAVVFGLTLSYEYLLAIQGRLAEDKNLLKKLQAARKKPKLTGLVGILALLTSIIGLAAGGGIMVHSVTQLANLLAISTTVLGLTITAIATSAPELIMTLVAGKAGENKIVVGTLVGSNIFNLSLLPAIPLFFSTTALQLPNADLILLAIATFLFAVFMQVFRGKTLPIWSGLILLLLYGSFLLTTFSTIL